jgi:hypothetical protein
MRAELEPEALLEQSAFHALSDLRILKVRIHRTNAKRVKAQLQSLLRYRALFRNCCKY